MRTLLILVTHNGYSLTKNCLTSLKELPSKEWKIVVADNASSDGTPKFVREEFPEVEVYETGGNLGFGKANNLAFKKANQKENFEYVCLLNNDTIPSVLALETLRNSIKKSKDKIIFAPRVLNPDGSIQRNDYKFLSHRDFLLNAFRSVTSAEQILHETLTEIKGTSYLKNDWMNGVCLMMKSNDFLNIGFFDEKFFMYYEDTDFALRANKLGFSFYMDKEATITHLGGASAKSSLSQALQHDKSQAYFYHKHFGISGLFISKIFRILRSVMRLPYWTLSGFWNPSNREKAKIHLRLLLNALKC